MVKLEKDIKLQKAFEETGEILDNCQNERFDPRAMTNVKIDRIIRSKRRTVSLEITRDARLVVRAPEAVPWKYIEEFVLRKQSWITDKQRFVRERYYHVRPKAFIDGEEFLYLGDAYRLSITEEGEQLLLLDREFHLPRAYRPGARTVFVNWYKQQAYLKIKERVDWYAGLFGLTYNKFSITHAQRLWGSCSARNNLHFSWRLVMAPLHVVDYVVIHELAHLKEKNHSKKFWDKVSTMLPDYKKSLTWLKENEHLFMI